MLLGVAIISLSSESRWPDQVEGSTNQSRKVINRDDGTSLSDALSVDLDSWFGE